MSDRPFPKPDLFSLILEFKTRTSNSGIAAELNAATELLANQTDPSHPALDKSDWLEQGFTIKGWGHPIELMVGPRLINADRFKLAAYNTIFIDGLTNVAAAYVLSDPDRRKTLFETLPTFERLILETYFGTPFSAEKIIAILEAKPYYGRLDQLAFAADSSLSTSCKENTTNGGLIPIELNRNGPEGIWFTHVAQTKYAELYGVEPPLPALEFIDQLLTQLAHATGKSRPVIGFVAPDDSIVSVVELPRIADALNRKGTGYESVYGNTSGLEVSGNSVYLNSTRLSAIWRNWGVEIQGNPEKTLAVYNSGIDVLNPPYSFVGGLKALFALISTDRDFRATLRPETRRYIDGLIPTTYFLAKPTDFDPLPKGSFIYKPAFSSHGDGVTSNQEIAFNSVRDEGVPYVAQAMVPPGDPSIKTLILDQNGSLEIALMLADFNNYLARSPEGGARADLVVTRFKSTHPINVAKGGGLGSGYPI